MARGETRAEQLRRSRELFLAAQAAGTTPAELTRRQAIARWSAIDGRLRAKRAAQVEDETPSQPWMMRD